MQPTRTVNLNFECYGITHHNNELVISDLGNTVFVYTVAGKLLRQIFRDKTGEAIFSVARNIVASDSGRVLFVADFEKDLVVVKRATGKKVVVL